MAEKHPLSDSNRDRVIRLNNQDKPTDGDTKLAEEIQHRLAQSIKKSQENLTKEEREKRRHASYLRRQARGETRE